MAKVVTGDWQNRGQSTDQWSTAVFVAGTKSFFDLKENSRGRFLKINKHRERQIITIPTDGLETFREQVQLYLLGQLKPSEVQIANKTFVFKVSGPNLSITERSGVTSTMEVNIGELFKFQMAVDEAIDSI